MAGPMKGPPAPRVALRGNYQPTEATSVRYSARLDAFDTHVNSFAADHDRTASLLELQVTHAINRDFSVQAGRINVREGNAYSFNPHRLLPRQLGEALRQPIAAGHPRVAPGNLQPAGPLATAAGCLVGAVFPQTGNPGPSDAWDWTAL